VACHADGRKNVAVSRARWNWKWTTHATSWRANVDATKSWLDCCAKVETKLLRFLLYMYYCFADTSESVVVPWPCNTKPDAASLKLYVIMYGIHRCICPVCLSDIVQMTSRAATRTGWWSAITGKCVMPRLQTKFGVQAFSHAIPMREIHCHQTCILPLVSLFFRNC